MAFTTTSNAGFSLRAVPGRILNSIWGVLMAIAEHGPRMDEIRKLNKLSDADLEAIGTTRADQVQRIFGPRMYL